MTTVSHPVQIDIAEARTAPAGEGWGVFQATGRLGWMGRLHAPRWQKGARPETDRVWDRVCLEESDPAKRAQMVRGLFGDERECDPAVYAGELLTAPLSHPSLRYLAGKLARRTDLDPDAAAFVALRLPPAK